MTRASGDQLKQYEQIGQRIKLLRERSKLSQEELARRIGARSASAIYYIEHGERRIKVLDLIAIANALGVSMDTLLLGQSKPDVPFGNRSSMRPNVHSVWGGSTLANAQDDTSDGCQSD